MAIAVVYRPPDMTAEQYKASWAEDRPPAPVPLGLVFHAGVGEGSDFFTITVWESQDAYNAFAPTFSRAMREMGFTIGKPTIYAVHHTIRPSPEPL